MKKRDLISLLVLLVNLCGIVYWFTSSNKSNGKLRKIQNKLNSIKDDLNDITNELDELTEELSENNDKKKKKKEDANVELLDEDVNVDDIADIDTIEDEDVEEE